MKTIKLIAVDLDGTLLTSDKSVSDRTIAALFRCKEKGIRLCFVTARGEKSSERAAGLCAADAMVTNGGALIRVDGEIIGEITLLPETANEIIDFAKTLPSFYRITLETPDGRYLVSKAIEPPSSALQTGPSGRGTNDRVASEPSSSALQTGRVASEHGAKGDYSHAEQYDFSKPLSFDVLKMVIYIKDPAEREAFAERFSDFAVYRYVNTDASFIADRRVRKWNGLLTAATAMGIKAEEIATFGDDAHDIEMIERSGVGIAVGNALPEVRTAADDVTGSNDEDGVAQWLEAHIL